MIATETLRAGQAGARATARGRERCVGVAGAIVTGPAAGERVAGRSLVARAARLLERVGCASVSVVPLVACVPASASFLVAVLGDVAFDRRCLEEVVARGRTGLAVARAGRGALLAGDASRVIEAARRIACDLEVGVEPWRPSRGVLGSAATADERRAVTRALLRATSKPEDGPFRRLFERRLAQSLTGLLVDTPVTPNQVTALSLAVGLTGALGLASGAAPVRALGAALVVLSKVGDTCDGTLARAKLLESPGGDRLDTAADVALVAAAFGAVAWRVASTGRVDFSTALLLVVGVLTACLAHEVVRRLAPDGGSRGLEAVRALGGRVAMFEWGYPLLAFAVVDRLDLLVRGAAAVAGVFGAAYLGLGLALSRPARSAA